MPKKPATVNNRRQFLKATVSASAAGLPISVLGQNAGTLPPIISLLLDENAVTATAVIEGEGPGTFVSFPDNTVTLNQGANTVERFFAKFRPSEVNNAPLGRDIGFDGLSAQLPEAIAQEVTLTVSAISPSIPTISVDTPSQTVVSDSSGLASFSEVLFEQTFSPGTGLENHVFELRFSSNGFDDYIITATLDLETPFLEPNSISVEAASAPGQRSTSVFLSGSNNTVTNFYDRLRPDLQNAEGGPEAGIRSIGVRLTPRPAAAIDVSLTAEVIDGDQITLDPSTATQTINTSSSFVQFAKINFIPDDFGPAGSANPVTNNHTIRFTWTADGYVTAVYDIVLDLESPLSPT